MAINRGKILKEARKNAGFETLAEANKYLRALAGPLDPRSSIARISHTETSREFEEFSLRAYAEKAYKRQNVRKVKRK